MISKCDQSREREILDYIGHDYARCLYLYLDLKKYGFDSAQIDVRIQNDEKGITAVLLKYYSCLHVYSKDNRFDAKELAAFFEAGGFTMLYCDAPAAERVFACLSPKTKAGADITKGWVAQIEKIDKPPRRLAVPAEESDFARIVELIYADEDIGRSYKLEELAEQIKQRNREGYARNLVIKTNGEVIAHACTNAEMEGIAVVAELIVKSAYRHQGYASEIWRTICEQLLNENKEVYSFYYSQESRNLHKHIGFKEVCEWAKVVTAQND